MELPDLYLIPTRFKRHPDSSGWKWSTEPHPPELWHAIHLSSNSALHPFWNNHGQPCHEAWPYKSDVMQRSNTGMLVAQTGE